MPSYTDRELRKQQEAGQLGTAGASNARAEVNKIHRRSRDFMKTGTENAATNVAATLMFTVKRQTATAAIDYLTGTNVANDTSDYLVITVTKQTAGTNSKTVATYNTHTSAQGAIVANIPASFSVVGNSDSVLDANDTLHYAITKYGSGKQIAIGTFTFDGEET